MSSAEQPEITVEPIITYPREAQVGKTYVMTIDLRGLFYDEDWPYEEEEYEIYCLLDTLPLFSNEPIGNSSIVLHCFGETYGPTMFLLTAADKPTEGKIKVTLVNGWGLPIQVINLDNIRVVSDLTQDGNKSGEFEITSQPGDNDFNVDELVLEIREKIRPYIRERCGMMRVLDMNQAIGLNDIYTNVNILETITGRRRLTVEDLQAELLQNSDTEEFNRFGLYVTQKRVPGLDAVHEYGKLMVLGKPGVGKTTFLKYLAIQCIEGQFQSDRFPIFITLKDFAEAIGQSSILDYIAQQLSKCQVTDADVKAKQLLKRGKALILLDGLDEVREEDTKRVLNQVQEFSYQFSTNQFVITCRIAAKEYTFQGFTEVEVADFDEDQIATFAQNWFRLKDPFKGERFIQKLKENKPIQELATHPLLLTLLCLVFGEAGDFPTNRSELYTEGVDVLLKKWDVTRNIERDQVYKKLSLKRKEDLLSRIALGTFEQGNYLFKQKEVERYIVNYIRTLPDASTDPEALQLYSEAVLKSIEAQHGLLVERARKIYSFSHLTFHEYFTAKIVSGSYPVSSLESSLQSLATHITEKRWREVFLLTVEMLQAADILLQIMKQKIDELLAGDEKLQQVLFWVEEKSKSVEVSYKPAAVRAFYLDFVIAHYYVPKLDCQLYSKLDSNLPSSSNFYLDLGNLSSHYDFTLDCILTPSVRVNSTTSDNYNSPTQASILFEEITAVLKSNSIVDPNFHKDLQQLANKHSNVNNFVREELQEANRQNWTEQLRSVMIEHRNIGHDWQFSDSQKKLLKQYYDANKLLVDCLNSDCYISREVRQEIEDTLLLPVKR